MSFYSSVQDEKKQQHTQEKKRLSTHAEVGRAVTEGAKLFEWHIIERIWAEVHYPFFVQHELGASSALVLVQIWFNMQTC